MGRGYGGDMEGIWRGMGGVIKGTSIMQRFWDSNGSNYYEIIIIVGLI